MTPSATADPPTKVEDFKKEAGEAVGPMPPKPQKPEPDFDPEIVVSGSGQLSFSIGGKRPTASKLKVTGRSIEVSGQFEKGQLLEVRATIRVEGVDHADKRDSSTDDVIDCVRTHKAKIVAFKVEE